WFGKERRANRAICDALYGEIVAAARQPVLYAQWQVPDTPLGRFEMVALHMLLVQRRLRGEAGAAAAEIGQVLTDEFFADLDHSLRELGIGDMGMPKRMKRLARMFYGRTRAYGDALDAGDRATLAAALARNVRPDVESWPESDLLAEYADTAARRLAEQPIAAICAGQIAFPTAGDGR
ncbi:MAG: ubiquinol-cytochrome C chaperone, partial [Rhizobiaceae bacterium]|nr:ubiquinol-cytochrome C chaperone [Rhizobiaceae bacterium]